MKEGGHPSGNRLHSLPQGDSLNERAGSIGYSASSSFRARFGISRTFSVCSKSDFTTALKPGRMMQRREQRVRDPSNGPGAGSGSSLFVASRRCQLSDVLYDRRHAVDDLF
jgi:hypothetical protein